MAVNLFSRFYDELGTFCSVGELLVRDALHAPGGATLASLNLGGVISPAAIGGTVDDYAPAGLGSSCVIRQGLNAGGATLDGLKALPAQQVVVLQNISAVDSLVLVHEAAGSAAENRFKLPGDVNATIPADGSAMLLYDGVVSRYRLIAITASAQSSTGPSGVYGDGSDGTLVFNGVATVLGLVPVANVYTMNRDITPLNMTIAAGVTVQTANFRVYVKHALTLNGTLANDGPPGGANGFGGPGGVGLVGSLPGSGGGGQGGRNGNGAAGTNSIATVRGMSAGAAQGCAGGANAGGAGGVASAAGVQNGDMRAYPWAVMGHQPFAPNNTVSAGAGGGGGASNDVSSAGGGGGAGGGWLVCCANTWTGAGLVAARGGNGGNAVAGGAFPGGGGGGGQGGVVVFVTTMATMPASSVAGGGPGASVNGGGAPFLAGAGVVVDLSNS